MAIKSREFVGIAEGIRSHELSTKKQIENLKGCISKLSSRRKSLSNTISYLEAAIAAEYERRRPDREYIAELKAEKSETKEELADVESELNSTNHELNNKENELQEVEEEKAQTLFEIQERARKTSNNISLAGGMYADHVGVGSALQNSFQISLSSLGQAANILGGSVGSVSGGAGRSSSSGSGSISSPSGEIENKNAETGALTAFTAGNFDGTLPLSANRFTTAQDHLATPATLPNYHSGKGTINTKKAQNFSTSQDKNGYAISSFGNETEVQADVQNADVYCSNQKSQNMEVMFSSNVYPTNIEGYVQDLSELEILSEGVKESFLDSQYRTVVTKEPIKLYRVYGGTSRKEGIYLTSQPPTDRMEAKIGLALKTEWKNSRENFCEVEIPKGTIINIGKAAPQITASGHILPGGMDQIVISRNMIDENTDIFGVSKDLTFKTGYKAFEKKVKEVEKQIKRDNKKQKTVKAVKKLFRRENVKKAIATFDIVMSLAGGAQTAREMPNTYENLVDNNVLEIKANVCEEKNLFELVNDMGYEVNNNVERGIKDVIIDAGQMISGIGGDEAALSDPFEKADETKEENETAILTKNSQTTSTEF